MRAITATFALALALSATGCMSPKGASKAEKRQYVLQVRDMTLDSLYVKRPEAKQIVESSPGYGVFSNLGMQLFIMANNHGYGVVTKKGSEKPTYMNMFGLGAGLGIGVKDFRAVFVFRNEETMNKFISEGWDFSAGGDATVMMDHDGAEISESACFDSDIVVYQMTKDGVMLGAAVRGTKYWPNKKLND